MLRTAQGLLATSLGRVGGEYFVSTSFPFHLRSDTQSRFFTTDARRFRRARATALLVPRSALRAVRCAPHGVAGKVAGKDAGMWFGPSAAVDAVGMLVDAFPACGMGVYVAADAALYGTEVFAASHSPAALSALHVHASSAHGQGTALLHLRCTPRRTTTDTGRRGSTQNPRRTWEDRSVLLLLGY
ncbi:hypothetical protein B0H14DRAFT_2812364, partial [Mycena olivaceomarginata]